MLIITLFYITLFLPLVGELEESVLVKHLLAVYDVDALLNLVQALTCEVVDRTVLNILLYVSNASSVTCEEECLNIVEIIEKAK